MGGGGGCWGGGGVGGGQIKVESAIGIAKLF